MPPKIFLTGATGYIGGSVLHALVTAHPDYDITVLLRKTPPAFPSTYPNVKIVQGDYDSADILAEQAAKADIVVHNGNSDHAPSLRALLSGLTNPTQTRTHTHTQKPTLIHLSGTGILSDWASPTHLGAPSPTLYSDLSVLPTLTALPPTALHRNTEELLFAAAAAHGDKINIVIMCPPDIYGRGTGLGNRQSVWVRMFVEDVRSVAGGRVFYYGRGENERSWVHVDDLTRLYVRVVEAAVEGDTAVSCSSSSSSSLSTNANANDNATDQRYPAYFFASTQTHAHLLLARAIGKILAARKVIEDPEPVQVSLETLDKMAAHPLFPMLGRYLYASNARTRADRAEREFGWVGRERGLMECLGEEVGAALGEE